MWIINVVLQVQGKYFKQLRQQSKSWYSFDGQAYNYLK